MSIICSYPSPFSDEKMEESYHKIDEIVGNKDKIGYFVIIYVNKKAKEDGKKHIMKIRYEMIPNNDTDSKNIFIQCYNAYKKELISVGATSLDDY